MKKYILVALTLGLNSPSYGATADSTEDRTVKAFGYLRAQSCDGAFTRDIIAALDAIPEANRVVLAKSVHNILGDNIAPQIGDLIPAVYNLYQKLTVTHQQRKAFEQIARGLNPDDIIPFAQGLMGRNGTDIEGLAAMEDMPAEADLRRAFLESLAIANPIAPEEGGMEDYEGIPAAGAPARRHVRIALPDAGGDDYEAMLAASLAPEEQVDHAPAAPRRAVSAPAAAALQRDAQRRAATASAVTYLRTPDDAAAAAVGAPMDPRARAAINAFNRARDNRASVESTDPAVRHRAEAAQARVDAEEARKAAMLEEAKARQAAIEADIAAKASAAQQKRMADYRRAQEKEEAEAAAAKRAAGDAAIARAAAAPAYRGHHEAQSTAYRAAGAPASQPTEPDYKQLFGELEVAVANIEIAQQEENEGEIQKWSQIAADLNAEIARLTA
jgi:hypothetical protein